MNDFEAKVNFKQETTARQVVMHFKSKPFLNKARISFVKVSAYSGSEYCVIVNSENKEQLQYCQFFMKGVQWASETALE